jgi:hypothetical protein
MNSTDIGLDFGNTRVKVWMLDKGISIPAIIAFDKPVIIKNGKEITPNAISLLFRQADGSDQVLWFGQDVLASQSTIHKIDEGKYNPDHISVLFRAALYEWQRKYKISLSSLGKLEITTSMPLGFYQQKKLRTQAEKAYDKAFNRGQSHVKIRDGKTTTQIVTSFNELIRETVVWGKTVPRKNKLVLVVDLGGGTNDLALFNGSDEPVDARTLKNGLLHTYAKIDPINPNRAELKILRDKNNLPREMLAYWNQIENIIRTITREYKYPVNDIYLIGGGASLMPKSIKSVLKTLAPNVSIRDEFVNAKANWKKASESG